ncbi:hypothetical protein [Micromonospora sp. MH33]|uniref:hypothetical protein n=1 Tax=Micromonospora sp. MH33 TaxID=1945509 RepID=UPI0011B2525F|nr:hypothetical protein [Micromonospora sp. MH33]
MSQLFGEVAGAYHEARPGYPAEIVAAIRAYHGGTPDRLVEVGAGTGLATGTLLGLGAPTTCVEPDHRMARALGERFPQVEVVTAAFESADPQRQGDLPDGWFHDDIAGSGLFTDVRAPLFCRELPLDTAAYLRLVGTFSPQLRRPPALRERVLTAVGAAIDGFGGTVVLDLRTTLVLARRPA